MRDVTTLWNAGYALGASLENTLVVSDNRILNPEGKRFPDEFVRHKMLDAVGDLALAGAPLLATYRSVRGGHKLNHAVLCALMADASAWTWVDADALRPPRGHAEVRFPPVAGLRARYFLTRLLRTPIRACHIPGEMSAYFLRPDGDLSGRRRGDKARCGRSDARSGEGHPIHVFAIC